MIEDDYPGYAYPEVEPKAGAIANALSRVIDTHIDLKQSMKAGLDREFNRVSEAAQFTMGDVLAWIEQAIGQACAAEKFSQDDIRAFISSRLDSAQGVADLINATIRKALDRLERKQQRAKTKAADRERRKSGITEPQTLPNDEAPASTEPGGGQYPPGLSSPPKLWPEPPTADEIAGLIIDGTPGQPALTLSDLPAFYWQSQNDQRIWLSLELTPVSRGLLWTKRITGGIPVDAGSIYLNIAMPLSDEAIREVLNQLGANPATSQAWTYRQAWDVLTEWYGVQVIEQVWAIYGIPIPVRPSHEIPPLNQWRAQQPPEIAPETPDGLAEPPKPDPEGFTRVEIPEPPAPPCEPVINPVRPRADIDFGQFTLDLLTRDLFCRVVAPVWTYLGVDPNKMPPCASLRETMRYLDTRIRK